MTMSEDEKPVGLSSDYSLLRRLNKQKDAHYEAAAKDSFVPEWKTNPGLLPLDPPSSARMKCVPAAQSTGCLQIDTEGSLTFGDSVSDMKAAEPVSEVSNGEV